MYKNELNQIFDLSKYKNRIIMQKTIITLVLFVSGIIFSYAQENRYTITVKISGMESDKGKIYVALYNQETFFLKKGFRGGIAKISNKKSTVIFKNIPKGTYAISAFHDENNNQKLDTYLFGIPKEDTGCSNGAVGNFGPPKYEDAKFNLTKNTIIPIVVN